MAAARASRAQSSASSAKANGAKRFMAILPRRSRSRGRGRRGRRCMPAQRRPGAPVRRPARLVRCRRRRRWWRPARRVGRRRVGRGGRAGLERTGEAERSQAFARGRGDVGLDGAGLRRGCRARGRPRIVRRDGGGRGRRRRRCRRPVRAGRATFGAGTGGGRWRRREGRRRHGRLARLGRDARRRALPARSALSKGSVRSRESAPSRGSARSKGSAAVRCDRPRAAPRRSVRRDPVPWARAPRDPAPRLPRAPGASLRSGGRIRRHRSCRRRASGRSVRCRDRAGNRRSARRGRPRRRLPRPPVAAAPPRAPTPAARRTVAPPPGCARAPRARQLRGARPRPASRRRWPLRAGAPGDAWRARPRCVQPPRATAPAAVRRCRPPVAAQRAVDRRVRRPRVGRPIGLPIVWRIGLCIEWRIGQRIECRIAPAIERRFERCIGPRRERRRPTVSGSVAAGRCAVGGGRRALIGGGRRALAGEDVRRPRVGCGGIEIEPAPLRRIERCVQAGRQGGLAPPAARRVDAVAAAAVRARHQVRFFVRSHRQWLHPVGLLRAGPAPGERFPQQAAFPIGSSAVRAFSGDSTLTRQGGEQIEQLQALHLARRAARQVATKRNTFGVLYGPSARSQKRAARPVGASAPSRSTTQATISWP